MGVLRIVRSMGFILIEGNGVGQFLRLGVDGCANSGALEHCQTFAIEGSNGFGSQRNAVFVTARGSQHQAMVDEVELNLKCTTAIGDRGGGQASGVDVERGIPPVILAWREREADFPYHLRPQVEGVVGIFPLREWQGWPFLERRRHTSDYAPEDGFCVGLSRNCAATVCLGDKLISD